MLCLWDYESYQRILNQVRTGSDRKSSALYEHRIHRPDTQKQIQLRTLIHGHFPDWPLLLCYGPYAHMAFPTDKGVIGEYENLTIRIESPYFLGAERALPVQERQACSSLCFPVWAGMVCIQKNGLLSCPESSSEDIHFTLLEQNLMNT